MKDVNIIRTSVEWARVLGLAEALVHLARSKDRRWAEGSPVLKFYANEFDASGNYIMTRRFEYHYLGASRCYLVVDDGYLLRCDARACRDAVLEDGSGRSVAIRACRPLTGDLEAEWARQLKTMPREGRVYWKSYLEQLVSSYL